MDIWILYVTLTNIILPVVGASQMYFSPHPAGRTWVHQGGRAELNCGVKGSDEEVEITWMHYLKNRDTLNVESDGRIHIDGGNLVIYDVTAGLDDQGAYTCIATEMTSGQVKASGKARIVVKYISENATIEMDTTKLNTQGSIDLKCKSKGNPTPRVTWYKNFDRIMSSNKYAMEKDVLTILDFSGNGDNGVYSCKASNNVGHVMSKPIILNKYVGEGDMFPDKKFQTHIVAKIKTNVTLKCGELTTFKWSSTSIHKNSILSKKEKLIKIDSVTENDAGSYICTNGKQNFATNLTIASVGSVDIISSSSIHGNLKIYASKGSNVYVLCKSKGGFPKPTISWSRLNNGGSYNVANSDIMRDALNILKVKPVKGGTYVCSASNIAGINKKMVEIIITEKPNQVEVMPRTQRRSVGQSAEFQCSMPQSVTSSYHSFTWRKDKEILPKASLHHVISLNGKLKLNNIRETDEGNYICYVYTKGFAKAVVSNTARLTVLKSLKFKPVLSENVSLQLGSDDSIDCQVESAKSYTVHWTRKQSRYMESNLLHFIDVKKRDQGYYTCVVEDSDGEIIRQTVRVIVGELPIILAGSTSSNTDGTSLSGSPSTNVTAYETQPTMLHCRTSGDPKPMISWFKDGLMVDRNKVLSNGSMYLSKTAVQDSGDYVCRASNAIGEAKLKLLVSVANVDAYRAMLENKVAKMDGDFDATKTIVVAVTCALAYLAVVIAITAYCSVRVLRKRRQRKQGDGTDSRESCSVPERTELMKKADACYYESSKSDAYSHSIGTAQNDLQIANYPRNDLLTLRVLGKGHYGDVFLAKSIRSSSSLVNSDPNSSLISDIAPTASSSPAMDAVLLVKSLINPDQNSMNQYRKEVTLLTRCHHQNIVTMFGVCEEIQPYFLVTEYCDWGDLKQFLLAMRSSSRQTGSLAGPLSPGQRLTICVQVAAGLRHIAEVTGDQGHGDVAARNVLLTPRLDAKLSIAALSSDVYACEYALIAGRRVSPRWASPESIGELANHHASSSAHSPRHSHSGSAADVWSFGVFAWEVFSDACMPYAGYDDASLSRLLIAVAGSASKLGSSTRRPAHSSDSTATSGSCASTTAASPTAIVAMPPLQWPVGSVTSRDVALLVDRCCRAKLEQRPNLTEITNILGSMIVDSAL